MDNIKAGIDYPISFFIKDDYGAPVIGASVDLTIKKISDNSVILAATPMTDSGDGFYSYTAPLSLFLSGQTYRFSIDAGATAGASYRYQASTIGVGLLVDAADLIGAGSGGVAKTIEWADHSSNPVQGVQVYLTSDIPGLVRVSNNQYTNSDGIVTFWQENGAVRYAWGFKDGETWANPISVVF